MLVTMDPLVSNYHFQVLTNNEAVSGLATGCLYVYNGVSEMPAKL